MPSKQEIRSEETKRSILSAASQQFAERGFDAVTMREIAKEAGCSHTTIYLYFKDKEALLHQLSREPLQDLHQQMEAILHIQTLSPEARLRSITHTFLDFCFQNRTMYSIFFMTKASRVDEAQPELEVNQMRLQLFGLLRRAIQEYLQLDPADTRELAYARAFFYTLHGIVGTYRHSDEPLDGLMARLSSTFDLTIDAMLAGFKHTLNV